MGEMKIRKSVEINKPAKDVYAYVKKLKNQDEFSVWNQMDPGMVKKHVGKDGTVGFIASWDSQNKNVGAGAQEIKKLVPNKRVVTEMRFERPMKSVARADFEVEALSKTKTRLSWVFIGETKFPMSLFSFLFVPKLGKQLQEGIDNVKANLEK